MMTNRLFFKILLCFLSLLIPMVIIGVSTYYYSIHLMKKDFNQRIQMNLQSASDTIDLNIKSAQEAGLNFFYNEITRRLLVAQDEQDLTTKAEKWKIPRLIQQNENIVGKFSDRIFVFIDDREVYVSDGVNEFESFFGRIYRYQQYDASFWRELITDPAYMEFLPATSVTRAGYNEDNVVVPVVINQQVNNHRAFMVINISADTIADTLRGNAVFPSTQYVVVSGDGQTIIDPGPLQNDPEYHRAIEWLNASQEPTVLLSLQGADRIMTRVKSDLYGWNYYSITPVDEFERHTSSILLMTVILCLVLIIMGTFFSFVFSFKIYNPIRNIRNIVFQHKDLWDDAGERLKRPESARKPNEFDSITRGITRMVSSQRAYKMKYDRFTSEYVDHCFMFLLKGHTLNEEEILVDTLRSEFGFNKQGYMCCSILFDFKESFYRDIQDTERVGIIRGIKRIIWSVLQEQLPVYLLEYKQNLYVCIINADHEQEDEPLSRAFDKMLQIFAYDIKNYYDITIGKGSFSTSIHHVRQSFDEAMTAINRRSREKRFQIVDADKLAIDNRFYYSFFDEQKILNTLKAGDHPGLVAVLDDIIVTNRKKDISYEHIKLLFKELYITGSRYLAERGIHIKDTPMQSVSEYLSGIDQVSKIWTTDELKDGVSDFYRNVMELTRNRNEHKQGNLISMIEDYIQANYTKDLGLELVAEEMGLSVKYVSRVYKEKTGENLTDYINKVRIAKAKDLLLHTDMKIKDIPAQIGMNSRTTFLRVFKKEEGISPNEYRNINNGMDRSS